MRCNLELPDVRQQYEGYMNNLLPLPVCRQLPYLRKSCVVALTSDVVPRSSRDVTTVVLSCPVMAVRIHESAKYCMCLNVCCFAAALLLW